MDKSWVEPKATLLVEQRAYSWALTLVDPMENQWVERKDFPTAVPMDAYLANW
jgi:hypothetical protein